MTRLAVFAFLALVFLPKAACAAGLESEIGRLTYKEFKYRFLEDYASQGFQLRVVSEKELPEARGMRAEVRVVRAPAALSKFLGPIAISEFAVEVRDTGGTPIVFYVYAKKGGTERTASVQYWQGKDFAELDTKIEAAKADLLLFLYNKDCKQEGLPFSWRTDAANADRRMRMKSVPGFAPQGSRFFDFFFKELKSYEFRFTIVENPGQVELRIFGFPPIFDGLLPEPGTTYVEIKAHATDPNRLDAKIQRRNSKTEKSIILSPDLEQRAKDEVRYIFYDLYSSNCNGYTYLPK